MAEQRSLRTHGWAKAVTALVMTLLALVAAPATAGATTGGATTGGGEFAAQARSAGLTGAQARSLQGRVDDYLAKTHGTQVGANKIALDRGGFLLLTLPGEQRARDLDAKDAAAAAALSCPYTYVCAYKYEDFTGDAMFLFDCGVMNHIIWNTTGSWINNQRSTLYAKFYDSAGNLGWTSPGGYSEDRHAPWGWVWYLSPC
ncbi:peptidase inhibitor family I36 protein [Streptomyces sp. LMG1-1-1.1]|uniref:peptidase inhibitor family I36 protein n=1 Tax=Streptomyces sp. LMG1-1-1.1 TaxID=3135245 RepID=UPI003465836E